MIRVVTFDLDDTLWSVGPALREAEAAQWAYLDAEFPGIAERFGRERLDTLRRGLLDDHPELRHHISRFRQQLLAQVLMADGQSPEHAITAASAAFAVFLEARHRVDIYPGASDLLATLSGRYRLGALTNGNADVFRTPLGEFFDFAFRAEEIGASKPEPDLFRAALAHCGVGLNELVHVGDSHEHDVLGARGAGVRAIWLTKAPTTAHQAAAVISRLDELPRILARLSAAAE